MPDTSKEEAPASAGERQEREEKIKLSGLITFSNTLGDNAHLTILGTPNNDIRTSTVCLTDDRAICIIQQSGSAH